MNLLPPSQEKALVGHRDRIRQLERKAGADARPDTEEVAVWSHSGDIAVTSAGEEPEHDVQTGGQVVAAVVRLKTAGSSNTVVTFYLNGVSLGTVTLASGETRKTAYLGDYRAKTADALGCRITTAGTGAKGLSAKLRMKG